MKSNYRDTEESKDGRFSAKITQENNTMLDIYCKINNLNKTHVVNDIIRAWLIDKYANLREPPKVVEQLKMKV